MVDRPGSSPAALVAWLALVVAPATAGSPPAVDPRTDVIGLLLLPRLYGTEPCQRFEPEAVPVHAAPPSGASRPPRIGELRTTRPWTWREDGGCEGLRVEFVPATGVAAELPAQEHGDEQPAALVLEARDGGWYRVRLPDGSGWVQATPRDAFGPLAALLRRDVETFTDPAGATLRARPAADAPATWAGVPACTVPAMRSIDGTGRDAWIEVEFERDACCADDATTAPPTGTRGWLPLYRADGVPAVWFAARTC